MTARHPHNATGGYGRIARHTLRQAADPTIAAKWQQLDAGYAKYAAMRKASEYKRVRKRGGQFSPSDMVNASRGGIEREAQQAYEALGDLPRPAAPKNLFDRATNLAAEAATMPVGIVARIMANEPTRRRLAEFMLRQGLKPDIKAISPELLQRFVAGGGLVGAVDAD